MNAIDQLFDKKKDNLLAIYFTAGYPNLNDTKTFIEELQNNQVDLIEIGMPYSDPLADGETIQATGEKALKNGMNLKLLFEQVAEIKDKVHTPLILMGYFNQFLKFGPEEFLKNCMNAGISGLILPDMPLDTYKEEYQDLFEKYNQKITFLITPLTPKERVKQLAEATTGFLYMVSSSSTTGNTNKKPEVENNTYFETINSYNLSNIKLIGFGISNAEDYKRACSNTNGAIIGSAFLRSIKGDDLKSEIRTFVQKIRS